MPSKRYVNPSAQCHKMVHQIQCVPLATEPGISLIILTPTKILQQSLNRSMFVVWEMKRNVCVVCVCSAPNCCDTEQRSASHPACFLPDAPLCWSVIWLKVPTQYGCCSWVLVYVWDLMGISERESLPKQTTNHRRLESKHHRRNSGTESRRTGKDFPKYGVPGSILSGRKWWPLQISLQYPH